MINTSKRNVMIVCTLLLVGVSVQAGMLPQGKWRIKTINVEKNTNGNLQTTVYAAASEVKSHILCPQEWEINEKNIVLRYPNGREDAAEYTLEGKQLTIIAAEKSLVYLYKTKGKNLILTATYTYVNNLPTGEVERIEEKWIIWLEK